MIDLQCYSCIKNDEIDINTMELNQPISQVVESVGERFSGPGRGEHIVH